MYALKSMPEDCRDILQYDDHESKMGEIDTSLYPIQLAIVHEK